MMMKQERYIPTLGEIEGEYASISNDGGTTIVSKIYQDPWIIFGKESWQAKNAQK